jgi:predicted ester cyclase
MSSRDALFEPVRRLFDAVWNKGRPELVREIFAENVVLHAGDNSVTGRDTAGTMIAEFFSGFPDIEHGIEDLVIERDRHALARRWTSSRCLRQHRAHRARDQLPGHHDLPDRRRPVLPRSDRRGLGQRRYG